MTNNRTKIAKILFFVCATNLFAQPSNSAGLFRLKPSSPKELIESIYNNVIIGNDRLSDIETYMSSGLKTDYKKAIKFIKKGGKCDIPRLLSNGIFSGKLKGFSVDQTQKDAWSAEVNVTLNTANKDLSPSNELKKFDPKIYENVTINLVRRFVDWKIDDIKVSTPDLDHTSTGPTYKVTDLREILKACIR